ncbi:chromosome segregation protein SMC [Portibacter lacus]|uniref:Chromosome partition protein Smc n=1 Tax=Portibacter lacus TaxID=1099794 RepID=A0AA37SPA6_9BACT|nr:chromosome segregation protein SMC [Portibacter lacus]GLR16401.1 chromosome partition protein Smc [Portibacter lacus]
MRLKSLEIRGFKSFGNPTVLYFDENVTGVVGPNGSGKSNVVDAFRWVLGEQKSKELRLEQMGDVLFNGADKKQQANLAEVSITFDNTRNILPTEYNTVKITRALYRSGDSEYRINDVACRLKDIHLLLMDTGIGSNSYSIIELGMVDDILQDKENARRRMFEQAAGISKFKKRKKETLQKLKLTNADLERIEDLLFEIEKNLKDLEKQAKRTKRYFEIKEKYKEASIIFYKLKWDRLEEGVVSLDNQVEQHKLEYNQWTSELANKEAVLESEKRKNLEGEKNLSNFQKKLNDLLDSIRRNENEKNLLNQKIKFSENNINKAKQEIAISEPQLKESLVKRDQLEVQRKEKEEVYKAHRITLEKLQKNVEEINQQFQFNKQFQEEKFKNLQKIQNRIFEVDKVLAVTENRVETYKKEQEQNEQQILNIKDGLKDKEEAMVRLNGRLEILDKELLGIREKEENRLAHIAKTEKALDAKKDNIAKLNRSIDAITNERNLLQSMVENMEGFSESVKFLHSKWDGKKTLLSDVINTEEKYRAAAEQVLKPYLNYLIVNDLSEAKSAITLLSNSQKGKAQFFILDEIKSNPKTSGTLTSLASVIETDEKYKPLIELICGHVFIADEEKVYENNEEEIALIESGGGVYKIKGEITGGSVGLFEGKKIGRRKRIEQLDKVIAKEKSNIESEKDLLLGLQKELADAKSAKYDVEIRIKERHKTDAEKEIEVIKTKLENADANIEKINKRSAELREKEEESSIVIGENTKEKQALETEINELKSQVSDQDSTMQELTTKLSEARNAFNEQNIKLIQTENLLESLTKEIGYQETRSREIKKQIFDGNQLLDRQNTELTEANTKLVEITQNLQQQYELKSKEQDQLSTAEQDYFKARAIANEVEEDIRKISKKINDKQFLVNQLKDKLNDFKFKKNSIKERLSIEFEYKLSDLYEVKVPEDGIETELELAVEKYKRRLDNYGEINPMALEAYEEMEKRFVHIKEQRDDINKAKVSLMNTISEIEETATQLFLDSFNEVRKHFVTVFRSLFTQDDDCDLILEDPNDPLNSKIEIIAKPKGKRPKSLSQLSGGEKTLTATALLFSLYLLKPAPFCIFDEVDAPLDDTNIQKFANIIRAFSDKSQFIIVTHNKATMAEVDVLYGVFMQKKGISSVSAVDFRSYEDKGTVEKVELKTY